MVPSIVKVQSAKKYEDVTVGDKKQTEFRYGQKKQLKYQFFTVAGIDKWINETYENVSTSFTRVSRVIE